MKPGTPEYDAALSAMVEILRRWAQEGRIGSYLDLSTELKAQQHRVHHRGPLMSQMLADACLHENRGGQKGMLTSIVIGRSKSRPSDQFFVLAQGGPFHRTDEGWS